MDIQLKDMKLIFTLNGDTYTCTVEDLEGGLIWTNGEEPYDINYGVKIFDEWEAQMIQLPFWNIVEVEKNIE